MPDAVNGSAVHCAAGNIPGKPGTTFNEPFGKYLYKAAQEI
jgi:hypothetical protein